MKTINLKDIKIKELIIGKNPIHVSVLYIIKDSEDKDFQAKRIVIDDFNLGQVRDIEKLEEFIGLKIKQKEGL